MVELGGSEFSLPSCSRSKKFPKFNFPEKLFSVVILDGSIRSKLILPIRYRKRFRFQLRPPFWKSHLIQPDVFRPLAKLILSKPILLIFLPTPWSFSVTAILFEPPLESLGKKAQSPNSLFSKSKIPSLPIPRGPSGKEVNLGVIEIANLDGFACSRSQPVPSRFH